MARFCTFLYGFVLKPFFSLYTKEMAEVEMVVAVFGGVTALVTACFAGAKFSRCTLIKTPCLELHRDVPTQTAQV